MEAAVRLDTLAASPPAPSHPERIAYIADLIEKLLHGRVVTSFYNVALLVLLLVFTAVHWRRKRADLAEWRARLSSSAPLETPDSASTLLNSPPNGQSCSPPQSPVYGTATPPSKDLYAESDTDVERLPLLRLRSSLQSSLSSSPPSRTGPVATVAARLRALLAYQPAPIPVINRALPSNSVTLFVVAWLALNAFFHLWQCPLSASYFFVPADRAGFIFIVNLPLLYLLSAKNQPLRLLTGRSYEALNIFHRRVGEFMCFVALLHTSGMILFQFVLAPEWLNPVTAWQYFTNRLILLGFAALIPYELLFLTSLGTVRQRCYELFLLSHVVLQLAALFFLYLHFPTARPYVLVAAAIFVLDRLVWRLCLKSATVDVDVCVLQDGETMMLSAEWDIAAPSAAGPRRRFLSWLRPADVVSGWRPTDHVFLTIPCLGRSHALQAHPFTIASAAPFSLPEPKAAQLGGSDGPTRARLNLLIRTHSGFTRDLLRHVRGAGQSPAAPVRLRARLDGPYGSSHALDMLRACDQAVLVAGGSGIAVVYPLAAALLLDDASLAAAAAAAAGRSPRRQRVRLVWITRSRAHADWIPPAALARLVDAGLDLVVPPPTEDAGRPDTAGIVRAWIRAEDRVTAVVVSGPDSMNREVRNACAATIAQGAKVRVAVEKFGW